MQRFRDTDRVQQVLVLAAVEVGVAAVEDKVDIGPTGEDADAPVGHVRAGEPLGENTGAVEVRCWRSAKSSPAASLKATALAAMTCSSGPP
jgi:hypothetical protein